MLHHGSLVRKALESGLSGEKEKTEEMLLSWLLAKSDEDMDFSQLKELAQDRTR